MTDNTLDTIRNLLLRDAGAYALLRAKAKPGSSLALNLCTLNKIEQGYAPSAGELKLLIESESSFIDDAENLGLSSRTVSALRHQIMPALQTMTGVKPAKIEASKNEDPEAALAADKKALYDMLAIDLRYLVGGMYPPAYQTIIADNAFGDIPALVARVLKGDRNLTNGELVKLDFPGRVRRNQALNAKLTGAFLADYEKATSSTLQQLAQMGYTDQEQELAGKLEAFWKKYGQELSNIQQSFCRGGVISVANELDEVLGHGRKLNQNGKDDKPWDNYKVNMGLLRKILDEATRYNVPLRQKDYATLINDAAKLQTARSEMKAKGPYDDTLKDAITAWFEIPEATRNAKNAVKALNLPRSVGH